MNDDGWMSQCNALTNYALDQFLDQESFPVLSLIVVDSDIEFFRTLSMSTYINTSVSMECKEDNLL